MEAVRVPRTTAKSTTYIWEEDSTSMTQMVIAGKLLLTPISPTPTNFGIELIEPPALGE